MQLLHGAARELDGSLLDLRVVGFPRSAPTLVEGRSYGGSGERQHDGRLGLQVGALLERGARPEDLRDARGQLVLAGMQVRELTGEDLGVPADHLDAVTVDRRAPGVAMPITDMTSR